MVLGQSDFESGLAAELKSSIDGLDEGSFADSKSFEEAMTAALGKREFVEQFPVSGKNAVRALEKESFASRVEFMKAVDGHIDRATLDGHAATLVNKGLNINAFLVLMAIVGFIAAFAISLGPVMWAMFSEIFPNRLRGLAISLAGFFNSLVSYTVQQVFPWELSRIGPGWTFFIFGSFATLAFLFTVKFIPETKGKSLEELEDELVRSD